MRAMTPPHSGRPPRARGRRSGWTSSSGRRRTTPACAGTTFRVDKQQWSPEDDPRVRGDDGGKVVAWCGFVGRPPRARGRLHRRHGHGCRLGTTPACAGTTARRHAFLRTAADDPRVRGDDVRYAINTARTLGRPPRARGRPVGVGLRWLHRGTTPACAGTTSWGGLRFEQVGDDPRVRGDDHSRRRACRSLRGRPPRARGRPRDHPHRPAGRRTTPACAGTTATRPTSSPMRRDDPRVRGDDLSITPESATYRGRPPRARGRHLLTRQVIVTSPGFHSVKSRSVLSRRADDLLRRSVGHRHNRQSHSGYPGAWQVDEGVHFRSHSPLVAQCRERTRKRLTCGFGCHEPW